MPHSEGKLISISSKSDLRHGAGQIVGPAIKCFTTVDCSIASYLLNLLFNTTLRFASICRSIFTYINMDTPNKQKLIGIFTQKPDRKDLG